MALVQRCCLALEAWVQRRGLWMQQQLLVLALCRSRTTGQYTTV